VSVREERRGGGREAGLKTRNRHDRNSREEREEREERGEDKVAGHFLIHFVLGPS